MFVQVQKNQTSWSWAAGGLNCMSLILDSQTGSALESLKEAPKNTFPGHYPQTFYFSK